MSELHRRFLVHSLSNRATSASRQSYARAKVHPVDTSLSVESLTRAGVDLLTQREHLDALLESHVVNQLVAAAQWADADPWCSYWRLADSRGAEVDLVLEDPAGRKVGVEVKLARAVGPADLRGLQALHRSLGMHRGLVVYTGNRLEQLADNIWALPVSALGDAHAFPRASGTRFTLPALPSSERQHAAMTTSTSNEATTYDATIFLSYVHADDERSGGKIVRLAQDLVETYSYLYGHEIRLFVDRTDLHWGERWSERLTHEIDTTTFLLSAVTPRYLKSTACRDEVTAFTTAAKRSREPRLLLPLIWVDIATSDVVAADDPVRVAIMEHQFLSLPELRRLDPGTADYETALEAIAAQLKSTIDHRAASTAPGGTSGEERSTPEEDDLLTVLSALETDQKDLQRASEEFAGALTAVGDVVSSAPPAPGAGGAAMSSYFADLGSTLEQSIADADAATAALGQAWQAYETPLARIVGLLSDAHDQSMRDEIVETLESLDHSLDMPQLDALAQQLVLIGNLSRHMRPLSQSFSNAVTLLHGIRASVNGWLAQM